MSEKLIQKAISIYQYDDGMISLTVKENQQYRWLEYGGSAIQSMMDKARPEQVILPVFQSLLVFLLLDNTVFKSVFRSKKQQLLSLGLGGASLERALVTLPEIDITSVDASKNIIEVAKRYFNLPPQVQVICQTAEQYIKKSNNIYDVVLCDLFIDGKSADCIFNKDFYLHLSKITKVDATVMINLQADNNEQLIQVLLIIKHYFPFIALIEFDDYKNIVILTSKQRIPSSETLLKRFKILQQKGLPCVENLNLEKIIKQLRYIPNRENKP